MLLTYASECGEPWTWATKDAEVVQIFSVSLATIKRYLKQRREEEGHVRPKAIAGRPPKKRAQVEVGVLPQLQGHDDATLEQHCAMWEQIHGERVSRWTMSRAIKQVRWTRKKVDGSNRAQRGGADRLARKRGQASHGSVDIY